MVNNPQFDNLPPIKLIHIQDQAPSTLQGQSRSREIKISLPIDIRWIKVLQFLRSTNLAPNSRKLYERELKRFLGWTQLHYHELRPRHLGLYKEYLRDKVKTDAGKPLSKASINAGVAALKSFFNWICCTYPEIIATNPTVGIKLEKVRVILHHNPKAAKEKPL
jgi:integrase/recombinase XerD